MKWGWVRFRARLQVAFAAALALLLLVESDNRLFTVLVMTPLAPVNDSTPDESQEEETANTKTAHVTRRMATPAPAIRSKIAPPHHVHPTIRAPHTPLLLVACDRERVFPMRC